MILLIQFVAMGGAVLAARVAARIGAKRAMLISLVIWCMVILYTYLELRSKAQAVAIGVVIGVVLGGSQALSRSLWSQLIPVGQEATFFGLFEVANEGTAWAAPLLFTIVVNTTGSSVRRSCRFWCCSWQVAGCSRSPTSRRSRSP